MIRFTHAELACLHDKAAWPVLWEKAIPLVKLAIRKIVRSGTLRNEDADDDLLQEGMLIAGEAIRSWRPLECAFSTHVVNRVRWDLMKNVSLKHNGGVGSYKQRPAIFNLSDSRDGMFGFPGVDYDEGDEDDDGTFEATLTYEGVRRPHGQFDGAGNAPRGYGDPLEEASREQHERGVHAAVAALKPPARDMAQSLYGIGRDIEHIENYAARVGLNVRTAYHRRAALLKSVARKLPKFTHN